MQITKEQFAEWRNSAVTVEVMKLIEQQRDDIVEFLANGGTLNKSSAVSTDFVVGRIQGLNELLNIEYEESSEERREQYGH